MKKKQGRRNFEVGVLVAHTPFPYLRTPDWASIPCLVVSQLPCTAVLRFCGVIHPTILPGHRRVECDLPSRRQNDRFVCGALVFCLRSRPVSCGRGVDPTYSTGVKTICLSWCGPFFLFGTSCCLYACPYVLDVGQLCRVQTTAAAAGAGRLPFQARRALLFRCLFWSCPCLALSCPVPYDLDLPWVNTIWYTIVPVSGLFCLVSCLAFPCRTLSCFILSYLVFLLLSYLALRGVVSRLDFQVHNRGGAPTQQLAVQLNKNTFGIVPMQQQIAFDQLLVQGTGIKPTAF